jgi:hypothetical protein
MTKEIKLQDLENGSVKIEGVSWRDIALSCFGLHKVYKNEGNVPFSRYYLDGRPDVYVDKDIFTSVYDIESLKETKNRLVELVKHKDNDYELKRMVGE